EGGAVHVGDPLAYPDLINAVQCARAVVTDSGGLQKGAYLLGTPWSTVRTETEWVETRDNDWNQLVTDPATLADSVMRPTPTAERRPHYGEGKCSQRSVSAVIERTGWPALGTTDFIALSGIGYGADLSGVRRPISETRASRSVSQVFSRPNVSAFSR